MAKYEPPVTTAPPTGGQLRPPTTPVTLPPRLKPMAQLPVATEADIKATEAQTKKKKKKDGDLTWSDVKSALTKTPGVMGQMMLAAPGAVTGLFFGLGKPIVGTDEDANVLERTIGNVGARIGLNQTSKILAEGVGNTVRLKNVKLANEALRRGESPLPYVLEDVGNIALVLGGAGLAAKGGAAAAKTGATRAVLEGTGDKLLSAARVADTISDAPITLPVGAAGKGINYAGRYGRWSANRLRNKAAALEAVDPANPDIRDFRAKADQKDSRYGKDVFVDGVTRTLTNKVLRKTTNRVVRSATAADDGVRQAFLGIVDRPLYRDDINPTTGEAYGPLTDVEQQAVVAILNGRARLINDLGPRLNRTPAEIAQLGRYRYAPGAALTPEGAQLAVDFLNRNVDDVTGQRLANAAEQLSREVENITELARGGYGRRRPLEPMYDIPLPEPRRFAQRLNAAGRAEDAAAIGELLEQGFFDDLLAGRFDSQAGQDALRYLQLALEQAPDSIALDPSIYPPKERNNIAFYGRIRQAMLAQAAATAGGAPPGPGYPGGRPTPMDEGPTTGLQPEEFYDSINAPGAFSRMPERYLRNSIKQLERLRGRARQIGQKIVQIEMSIRNLEFKSIKASLRIEALEGYYTDANGNRLIPDEQGMYPPDATFNPGLIEKLIERRDAARAELARMQAEQAQTTVIDGKVHTVEQVQELVAEADQSVVAVEQAITELEAEIDAAGDQIDQMESAQADAANALEDLGENADALLEAAAKDADSVPGDPETVLQPDDGTAALDSARADVEAARTALTAARLVELEARAKITDLEARYRDEQAKYAAEVAKQGQQPTGEIDVTGLTADNVRAVIDDAEGKQIEPDVAASLRDALDSEYVAPTQQQSRSKLVSNIETAGQGGRLFVVSAFGKRYVTDSYIAIEITPTSPLARMFVEDGQYDNPWGSFSVKTVNNNGNPFIEATINGVSYTIERVTLAESAKGKPVYSYRLGKNYFKTVAEAKRSVPLNRRSDVTPNVGKIISDATEFVGDAPPATPIGRGNAGPGSFSVIVFENADGARAGFTQEILNGVLQKGDTLHFVDPNRPATIRRNGETIGIIMPVRDGGNTPVGLASVVARLPQEVAAMLPTKPKLVGGKRPKRPTITPDDLDAATAEWNNAQDAVRAADEALLAAQNQLRGVEAAAPAARLTPPAAAQTAAGAVSQGETILEAMKVDLADAEAARNAPGSRGGEFQRYSLTRIATRDAETALNILREAGADAQAGLTPIDAATTREALDKRSTDNFAARKKWEAAEERAIALGTEIEVARQEGATEAEVAKLGKKYDAAVQKAQEMKIAWAREELSIAAASYEIDLGGPAARLTPPPVEAKVQAVEPAAEPGLTPPSRYGVEAGNVREIVKRGSVRLSKALEQIIQAERDAKNATLARRELRKAGATAEELAAAEQRVVSNRARVAELKKQRVAVRDEMIAEAIEASNISFLIPFEQTPVGAEGPFGRAYYEGDMQLAIDERRGFIEGLGEYVDKIEVATADYQKAIRTGAAPNGARASQLRRRIEEARAAFQEQVRNVSDFNYRIGYAATKIADLDGIPRNDAAIALRDNLEARLAAPPPPEVISTSASTEADWQKQSDGTYTINTGSRRYAALKVDVTPPGAKGKRTTWALKRYGSDGEVIEGSTQVFPNFKAARDYVQKQIDADGLDTGQRYIYRPGRELGPGPSTEVPVNLLAAEQRLQRAEAAVGSAEQRLQNLRTQLERNAAKIDKLRVDEAAQRAKLAPITGAAVRTEARLGPEIYTQPDMVQFAGQARGAPRIGRALTPEGVPVMAGEGLPAMLRPTQATIRTVDEQIRAVNEAEAERGVPVEERSREVVTVEKAVNEALLRRRAALPPSLPARVALAAPREVAQPFIGSQYLPVGRKVERARGARTAVEVGMTGDVLLRSEKRRSGMGDEIYDILELGRILAAERRQMELNEGFRMLLNSQFALTPEQILGEETIRRFEQQAYDTAVDEWAAYAPGVPNRNAVFEATRREIYGSLINDAMNRAGFETLPAEGYIGGTVAAPDIDSTTKFLPVYAREKIMQRTTPVVPAGVNAYLRGTARVTTAFKNLTLPLSVIWQIGDLIGIFWSAAVTGVNPLTMSDYMVQMLRENYGGPDATRLDILRNIFKDPEDRRVTELADLLSASGLQDTGLRIQETRRFRGEAAGAEPQTVPQRVLTRITPDLPRPTLQGGRLGVTRGNIGNLMPAYRKGAYRINEAINRVGRHAYFLAKFGEELAKYNDINGTNLTVEDVGAMGLHQRPGPLRNAWEDTIDTANEVMGDWLDLTPKERRYVLPHLTFWAWTKHIHKMFVKVAKENPAAIKWQLYLGSLAYDPDSDPLELYSSYIPTPGGGLAGSNFLNPFGDIVEGPLGQLVLKQDPSKLFSGLSPVPRIAAAALPGFNLARMRTVTRQYGTGAVTETGGAKMVPLITRPTELLGFAAQQFPIGTKLLDLLPSGQLPGTSIQTGPFERYDTGQARFKPMTSKPVPKFGGRLLTAARLLTLPGVPTTSIEKMRDIERRAQQRLRAFETARKLAEARND